MSKCISNDGEYSDHELDGHFTCKRCYTFDESAALRRIGGLESDAVMKLKDIRLGQTVTLTGEVHTMSVLGPDDKILPADQLLVTMLVKVSAEPDGNEASRG